MKEVKMTGTEHVLVEAEKAKDYALDLGWEWFHYTCDNVAGLESRGDISQLKLFEMFPEIRPNFFKNFDVARFSVRTGTGHEMVFIRKEPHG
jgi:hypothetical protein